MGITDQQITEIYEMLSSEHMQLMQNFVNTTNDANFQKQLNSLNSLLISLLKYKCLRKKAEANNPFL